MSKDYAKNDGRQKPPKQTKRKIYWLIIAVLIGVFIAVNYISIKNKRERLHEKQAAAMTKKNNSTVHPVTFSVNQSRTPLSTPTYYTVQVATVTSEFAAKAWQSHLAKLGYHARLDKIEMGQNIHYRVQLGPYSKQAKADQVKKILKKHDVSSLVVED